MTFAVWQFVCVLSVVASAHRYNAFFVDLFVRVSNVLAISMYQRLGYVVYRQVLLYYSGEEDAYGAQGVCLSVRACMRVWACACAFQSCMWPVCPLFSDMRKALPRDADKKSMIPLPHPVSADSLIGEWQ